MRDGDGKEIEIKGEAEAGSQKGGAEGTKSRAAWPQWQDRRSADNAAAALEKGVGPGWQGA